MASPLTPKSTESYPGRHRLHTGRRRRPLVPVDLRKRVSKACDSCRSRKQKCDGGSPCGRCAGTGKPCQYPEQEQTVHGLSPTSDMVSSSTPSTDHHEDKEGIVMGNSLTPDSAVAVHSQGKTHFHSGSSHFAFFDSACDTMRRDNSHADETDKEDTYHHFMKESATSRSHCEQEAIFASLPPRQVVDFLSAIFFQYAQANFFYIHPEIFKRKLEDFYARRLTNELADTAEFTCVLFMVLAIGSQFADVGVESEGETHPQSWDADDIQVSPNPGWRFYEVARKMLPDVVLSSSMTSIQACVLQGTFLFSTNARDVCYNVLGLALRMAINMGMHRSVETEVLHPHVRELRNRLWWSTYTAERIFSVEMGRPLAIDDSEIDAPFPVDIPALRVTGTKCNFDHQTAIVKLCQTMGKIVRVAFPKAASPKQGTIVQSSQFQQLRSELQHWEDDLPRHLRLSETPSRAVAHIHLTCQQARILLTRALLNYAATQQSQSQGHTSPKLARFLHENTEECLLAASKTVQILTSLSERSLICRFSFHDFLYCSTALYVLLLGVKLRGTDHSTKSMITKGLLVLSNLAKGSEAAKASLRLIRQGFEACLRDYEEAPWFDTDAEQQARKAWLAWLTQAQSPATTEQSVQSAAEHAQNATNWHSSGDSVLAASYNAGIVDDASYLWIPPHDTNQNFFGEQLAGTPNWNFFDQYGS